MWSESFILHFLNKDWRQSKYLYRGLKLCTEKIRNVVLLFHASFYAYRTLLSSSPRTGLCLALADYTTLCCPWPPTSIALLLSPAAAAQQVPYTYNPPTSTPPICSLLEVHFYGKYRLVHADCPLSRIWRSPAIREQLMYCVYGNSGWYINCCPLYDRCLVMGVSINGGSTVL